MLEVLYGTTWSLGATRKVRANSPIKGCGFLKACQSKCTYKHVSESEGTLIASDLLYEGNFNEWQKRTSAAFVVKGKPELVYPAIIRSRPRLLIYRQGSPEDIRFLVEQINPAILSRIPQIHKNCIGKLYAALKRQCLPFRLMDLATEIRLMIFRYIIDDAEIDRSDPKNKIRTWVVQPSHRLPALSRVAQTLRKEMLDLYFSRSIFSFDAAQVKRSVWEGKGYHATLSYNVNQWAKSFAGLSLVHLRTFQLRVGCEVLRVSRSRSPGTLVRGVGAADVELSVSKGDGLRVKYAPNLTTLSKVKIETLVAKVQENGNGQLGQAISRVVREGADVWHYRQLRLNPAV